ncbi:hypothetical protein Tco_1326874, partial [Tanacetum coccineum]
LQPKMTTVEEGVQTLAEQGVLVVALREDMDRLHRSTKTMSQQMQTLETSLQVVRKENQELQTRLSATEGNERIMVACIL